MSTLQLYTQFLNENIIPCVLLSREGKIIEVNSSFISLMGYEDHLFPEDGKSLFAQADLTSFVEKTSGNEKFRNLELKLLSASGEIISTIWNGGRIEEQGQIFATIISIQELVHANYLLDQSSMELTYMEQKARQNELKYQLLADHTGDLVCLLEPDFRFTFASPSSLEILGYEPDELTSMRLSELVYPDDLEDLFESLERNIDNGSNHSLLVFRGYKKDRKEIWLEMQIKPIISQNGEIFQYQTSFRDISQKRSVELALRKSQQLLKLVMDNIPFAIYWKDINSNFLGFNNQFAEIFNPVSIDESDGNEIFNLSKDERDKLFGQDMDVLTRNISVLHQLVTIQLNTHQEEIWFDMNKIPLHDENGTVVGVLGTLEDVSELMRSREELLIANRELAQSNTDLEQFAYIASHDLIEPLRMIGNYVQLLERRFGDKLDIEGREYVAFAVEGVIRMNNLLNDILEYSTVGSRNVWFTASKPEQIIREVINDLGALINERNAIVELNKIPDSIVCAPKLLKSVFQNLISNGIKFNLSAQPRVVVNASSKDEFWLFSIEDNGIGIEERYKDKIFKMFQRLNKREFDGSGIGLAICQKVVNIHQGKIWYDSEPGKGTTFHFLIHKDL